MSVSFRFAALFGVLLALFGAGPSFAVTECRSVFQGDGLLPLADSGDYLSYLGQLQKARKELSLMEPGRRGALAELKQKTASALISESLSSAAKELNEVILIRPLNPATLLFLERSFALKPMVVKSKTSRSGLSAGLVLRDFSPDTENLILKGELKVRQLHLDNKIAVRRGGEEIWAEVPLPSDQILEVLADGDGRMMTADVDVLMFARALDRAREKTVQTLEYGYVTSSDRQAMDVINHRFQKLDHRSKKRNLIQHGPENRNPGTQRVDYPVTAFHPDGRTEQILEGPVKDRDVNLKTFLVELSKSGYSASIPEAWGWKTSP